MQKYLITLFLLLSYLTAAPTVSKVNIDEKNVNITEFQMSYYIDTTEKMLLDDIKEQEFTDSSK